MQCTEIILIIFDGKGECSSYRTKSHSLLELHTNMAQFKALSAFVILFHLFMNTYGLSSVKTCRERLDSLESIVESLKEGFAKQKTNSDHEDMMLKIKLEGENRELKRRLKTLEAIVMTSSRRMERLEARIVELESTDHFPKFEFDELKTKSNQTNVPKENTLINKNSETSTTDNLMKIHVQRNNSATESRVQNTVQKDTIHTERKECDDHRWGLFKIIYCIYSLYIYM